MKYFKIVTLALISLNLISCAGGGGGGGSTNYNDGPDSSGGTFLDTGTSVTYNSTTASNHQAYDAYENVEGSSQSSYTNPFDQINAYKAYGYGYSGEGKQIAVMDSNFDTDHYTYQDKTVSTYGTLTADSTSSYHGNFVSSVAAGYLDTSYSGSVAMHGVAYNADLHLSDYNQKGSETYYPEQWANSLDDASEAVVQNNSWGVNEEYSSGTTYTSTSLGTMWNNAGSTANSTSVDSYVTALNNFQDHGVIVYAISNTDSFGDVDVQAALPEIYSQLAEAWITAVNVDITGSTYTRKSAPCGSTAKYCLGGDGWKINGAAYYTDDSYFVTAGVSGTSYVAPQISGAIAILAEAFPTQTPEQWADRLLASADNSFFTASGNVEFSNGITHAYNTEFGHGIMDIYAALRPITSSRMAESILIGDNFENASIHSLNKSSVIANPAFGDSITSALKNKKGIFYDALYGAFEYNYDNSFITISTIKNNYLEKHFDNSKYDKINKSPYAKQNIIASFHNLNGDDKKINYDNGISFITKLNNKNFFSSYNYPMELSLGFTAEENMSIMDSTNAFTIPYLAEAKNDFSFGTELIDNNNSSLTLGYLQSDNNSIDKQAIAASYTHKDSNTSFITGLTQEKKGFIGTSVSGAFNLNNSTTPTTFIGLNHSKKLGEKSNYGILIAAGLTNVDNNKDTNLFENISDIYTSNAGFYIKSKDYITINDEIKFSISQPQRVENGSALLLIPKRNDISGNLNFDKTLIDLEPSGRQVDLSLKYTNKLQNNMIINFENIISNNYNHSSLNKLNNIFVTSFIYKF